MALLTLSQAEFEMIFLNPPETYRPTPAAPYH